MKLLCEVPLSEVESFEQSQFNWLTKSQKDNFLCTLEDQRRLHVFAIRQNATKTCDSTATAHEAQSASLTEPRRCTSLSWNHDESLLALVVDKRQIYFWEVHRNTFVQFKPNYLIQQQQQQQQQQQRQPSIGSLNNDEQAMRKWPSGKNIEHIAWSHTSDKLVIGFANGQLLLCNVVLDEKQQAYLSHWERFIGNSDGVLERISSIQVSERADLFACASVTNELLVMTFEGENRLYAQNEGETIGSGQVEPRARLKFSPLLREYDARLATYMEHHLWLAYQLEPGASGLFLRRVSIHSTALGLDEEALSNSRLDVLQQKLANDHEHEQGELVDFYWLSSSQLLICLSSGCLQLVQIGQQAASQQSAGLLASTQIVRSELVHIKSGETGQQAEKSPSFKAFELRSKAPGAKRFALAAATNYQLFYYELYLETAGQQQYACEQFDEVDLTETLVRLRLQCARLAWSHDGAMLALQLNSGHLLVYQTQLLHAPMVASYAAKTAYLSAVSEITLLNYGLETDDESAQDSQQIDGRLSSASSTRRSPAPSTSNGAIILNLQFKPSLLAIGPGHLAVALNNRVRFYSIASIQRPNPSQRSRFQEQEYVSLVVGIGLGAKFVAIQLDDGRLKLHSLSQLAHSARSEYNEADDDATSYSSYDESNDERFFPDPTQANQRICAFALTEELLVYCTLERHIHVFSLKSWLIIQVYDHSSSFVRPIWRLKANERGNKFICLLDPFGRPMDSSWDSNAALKDDNDDELEEPNVHLYDLFTNQIYPLEDEHAGQLLKRLLDGQFEMSARVSERKDEVRAPKLCGVRDAIWDTDGRTILFIKSRWVHVFAVLEHTLAGEQPHALWAASAQKAASYSTLYVSQGIVSYQTSLGRVLNTILETYDDELRLTRLECAIKQLNESRQSSSEEVMRLKLDYLRSILPIYSLLKCRDICEHLMEERAFAYQPTKAAASQPDKRLESLLWHQLAAWSVFTLNLRFAHQLYKRHQLDEEARKLTDLFEEMRARGLDSRREVSTRLESLLLDHKSSAQVDD